MTGEDVLLTLGEVAIAVAGFSSVVAVFGRRAEREWSPVEQFRLAALLANALAPALLAFVPFGLAHLGVPEALVWATYSAALLLFVIGSSPGSSRERPSASARPASRCGSGSPRAPTSDAWSWRSFRS